MGGFIPFSVSLTIDVQRREHNGVHRRHGRQQESSGKARIPDPDGLLREHARRYKDVVSGVVVTVSQPANRAKEWIEAKRRQPFWPSLHLDCLIDYRCIPVQWWTHRILEPGPYWPETGQAQMTCNASSPEPAALLACVVLSTPR